MAQFEQVGLGVKIRYAPEPLTETYTRSWRERLFSLPWQPWVRTGVRPTTISLIKRRMMETQAAMQRTLDANMYGTYGGSNGRS